MSPKTGKGLPSPRDQFARSIGAALHRDLARNTGAIKTIMKWTGACERSAKGWYNGSHSPDGWHLILLARHSEAVLATLLQLAERDQLIPGVRLRALQVTLIQTAAEIGSSFAATETREVLR